MNDYSAVPPEFGGFGRVNNGGRRLSQRASNRYLDDVVGGNHMSNFNMRCDGDFGEDCDAEEVMDAQGGFWDDNDERSQTRWGAPSPKKVVRKQPFGKKSPAVAKKLKAVALAGLQEATRQLEQLKESLKESAKTEKAKAGKKSPAKNNSKQKQKPAKSKAKKQTGKQKGKKGKKGKK